MHINIVRLIVLLMLALMAGYTLPGWCEYRIEVVSDTGSTAASVTPGKEDQFMFLRGLLYDENGALVSFSDANTNRYTYCVEASLTGGTPVGDGQVMYGNHLAYIANPEGTVRTEFCPEYKLLPGSASYLHLPVVFTYVGSGNNLPLQYVPGNLNLTVHLKHDAQVVSTSSATATFRVTSGLGIFISVPKPNNRIERGSPVAFDFSMSVSGTSDAPTLSWELTSGPCADWSPVLGPTQSPAEAIRPDGLESVVLISRSGIDDSMMAAYPLTARFTPTKAGVFSCTALLTLAFP